VERKSWTVEVDGTEHEVVLEWTYWGGQRKLSLDGQLVHKSTIPMRWSSTQPFEIDGRPAVVRTRPRRMMSAWFVIDLEVDGQTVKPNAGAARWEIDDTGRETAAA